MTEQNGESAAQRWFQKENLATVEEGTREALRQVIDPELGINIVDLGLIYDLRLDPAGRAEVIMTLTSPGCPLGPVIDAEVKRALAGVYGLDEIVVTLVWSPPWRPEMMSEDARLELGYW